MDYSIPIDEVNSVLKFVNGSDSNWKKCFLSRSSKWSSALRGRMLGGAKENNKDGIKRTFYFCGIKI